MGRQTDLDPPEGRVRRPGAGRPSISEREPGLREALLVLLEGATRGDPASPLLWTSRSVANLTVALGSQGFDVAETTVRRQLKGLGFSLQANRKTHEGADHPDRDQQFRHIAKASARALASGVVDHRAPDEGARRVSRGRAHDTERRGAATTSGQLHPPL